MMFRTATTALFALLLLTPPAFANMAQPWIDGQIGSEPSGIPGVHVVHEDLRFELYREPGTRHAHDVISATYELRNDGDIRSSPLQFVAVGITDASTIDVIVNGAALPVTLKMDHPIPPRWSAPKMTPAPDGGEAYLATDVDGDTAPSILFDAELRPGPNEIRVQYEAKPSAQAHGRYWLWQTAYVLSPAKSWESFGTIDVSVSVPEGFDVATSLPLERKDGELAGSFDGIPADALTISLQQKAPMGSLVLFYLLLVGAALICCWLAPFFALRRWVSSTTAGIGATLAAAAGGVGALLAAEEILGASAPGWSYDILFGGVPLTIVSAVILGVVVTLFVRRG